MHDTRFDRISRLFADRRLSRRQVLASGTALAAGLATAGSATAQDATPVATPGTGPGEKITYLFVQSYQSGSIAPVEGQEGRYTVTLEQGLGQTIFFGDRPSREVGTTPTPQFLEGLGFSEDNPPNAALLVETTPGETDIAVVELFNPTYHPTTRGVTYEADVLEDWQDSLELGLSEAPADLATLAPSFGAAHLFIDDCAWGTVTCYLTSSGAYAGEFDNQPFCYNNPTCFPCDPYNHDQPNNCATRNYWGWSTYHCGGLAACQVADGCYADFQGSSGTCP